MHLYNDLGETPDEEGVELPDLDAARKRAISVMRELIAEDIRSGRDDIHLVLQLGDESGEISHRLEATARVTGISA